MLIQPSSLFTAVTQAQHLKEPTAISSQTQLSASPPGVLCLLQLVNPRWYIGVTRRPEFTLGFTLSVLYSMGLDTCIVTCVHHYIIQTISLPYKSCHLPVHTYLSPPNLAATDLFTVSTCILFLLPFLVVLNGNHQTFRN